MGWPHHGFSSVSTLSGCFCPASSVPSPSGKGLTALRRHSRARGSQGRRRQSRHIHVDVAQKVAAGQLQSTCTSMQEYGHVGDHAVSVYPLGTVVRSDLGPRRNHVGHQARRARFHRYHRLWARACASANLGDANVRGTMRGKFICHSHGSALLSANIRQAVTPSSGVRNCTMPTDVKSTSPG